MNGPCGWNSSGTKLKPCARSNPLTGEVVGNIGKTVIYPASHYVTATRDNLERAVSDIRDELGERLRFFQAGNKLVEAQRLEQRTQLDLEMMQELGYCTGIENYSRHLDGRKEGEPPATLLDYFPDDFVLFADECHISIPQVGGMFKGDRSRKTTLVDFGFRLPSALDNRPLEFHEFLDRLNQVVYVSATPGHWELERSQGIVAERISSGLRDCWTPRWKSGPSRDRSTICLLGECRARVERGERVLVTTLTKRMAEDLTGCTEFDGRFLALSAFGHRHDGAHGHHQGSARRGIRRSCGHRSPARGAGYSRSLSCGHPRRRQRKVSCARPDRLIQTFGRAARNAEGRVLLYADAVTPSMRAAMGETSRRRTKQEAWNEAHGTTPTTISKPLVTPFDSLYTSSSEGKSRAGRGQTGETAGGNRCPAGSYRAKRGALSQAA